MAYVAWSVVFGEQPSAAKWNILGTNDAYFDSIVGSGVAWSSWSPTLTGRFTDAKWNKSCSYTRVGNTILCKLRLIANTTTPMAGGTADAIFSLPVTAVALTATAGLQSIGTCRFFNAASAVTPADVMIASTTTALMRFHVLSGATDIVQENVTSTRPFTWTTNYEIAGSFVYEAA